MPSKYKQSRTAIVRMRAAMAQPIKRPANVTETYKPKRENKMKNIDLIRNFDARLIEAFRKMILGINVELSESGKTIYKNAKIENAGKWHFIQSIESDETITLCSQNHTIFSGLSLSNIKLNGDK